MYDHRDYEKLTKKLDKIFLKIEDIRSFVHNELVHNMTHEPRDKRHPDAEKYVVRLANGDVYEVYVKQE